MTLRFTSHWAMVLCAIIVSGCLAGCGEETSNTGMTVDSAGVAIISNPPVSTAQWSDVLNPQASVVLGGLRDDLQEEFLSRSPWMTAVRLSDRRIVASDGNHLKFYDPHGNFLGLVGREGSGPGEFRSI